MMSFTKSSELHRKIRRMDGYISELTAAITYTRKMDEHTLSRFMELKKYFSNHSRVVIDCKSAAASHSTFSILPTECLVKCQPAKFIFYIILIVTIIYSCHSKNWIYLDKEQSVGHLKHCIKFDVGSSRFNSGPNILLPDEDAAIKVAESYLFKTYGKDQIISQRPYGIGFVNGNWIIVGNLSKLTIGGYFEIAINSTNGKVIGMAHGK